MKIDSITTEGQNTSECNWKPAIGLRQKVEMTNRQMEEQRE